MSCVSDTAVIIPLAPVSPPEDTGTFSIPTLPWTIRSQRVGILLAVSKAMRKGFFIRNQGRQEAQLWKGHTNGNQAKNSDALLELLHGGNCCSGFYGEMAQL